MSRILDAVSVVLTFQDEIFIIQRQNYLKAFPGYWAFPGGKVEKTDNEQVLIHNLVNDFQPNLVGAMIRECQEELGIDLGKQITEGEVVDVNLLGCAVTPEFNPIRFATYFFKIVFKSRPHFEVDFNEARDSGWFRPFDFFSKYESGDILSVPPVIKVISELTKDLSLKRIEGLNFDFDSSKFVPYIESMKGVRQLMPLSNTLPPANRTNAFLIGDNGRVKILIDPSPTNEEYEKFKNTVALFGVDKIMLTHHHFDHHENAVKMAKELHIPILLSKDSHQRLLRVDSNYFDSVETFFLKEGDIITSWLGQDVVVYEVPGHDEGQLAVAPRNLNWFLAGDLFQGVGTVVIGGEEGSMAKYFSTLEKVIALNPKVVFPSHGIGLGGTDILQRTLEHRKVRENQVLTLHLEGKTLNEMLDIIYEGLTSDLRPFALKNILKHLDKLRDERKI